MIRSLLSKIALLAFSLILSAHLSHAVEGGLPGQESILINEINANTLWNNEEFIELKGNPGTVLDGLLVTLIDGSTKRVYYTISLTGYKIPPSGYFVIGNRAVANVDLVIQDDLTYAGLTNPNKLASEFESNRNNLIYPAGYPTSAFANSKPWPNGPLLPWPRLGEHLGPVFGTVANYPTGWGYGFLQGGQGNTPDAVALFSGKKDSDFQSSSTLYRAVTASDSAFIQDAVIYGKQADAFLSNILLSPAPSPAPAPRDDVSNFDSIGRVMADALPRSITGASALERLTPTPGTANSTPANTLTLELLNPATATLSENGGLASFRLIRSGNLSSPLVVSLGNFDTSELKLAGDSTSPPVTQVIIPAGASQIIVNLEGVNDSWKDDDQIVYITPIASNYSCRTSNTSYNPTLGISEPFAGSLGIKVTDEATDSVPYYVNEVNGIAGFGNANGFGAADNGDEFIEIVFPGTAATNPATPAPPAVNLAGHRLNVNGITRHIFPTGTYLYPNSSIVVFGAGDPGKQGRKTDSFGTSLIQNATTGGLGITDTGSVIGLLPAAFTVELAGWVFLPVQGGSNTREDLASDKLFLVPGSNPPLTLPTLYGPRHQLGHALTISDPFNPAPPLLTAAPFSSLRSPAAPFSSGTPPVYFSPGKKQDGSNWGFIPGTISLAFTHIDAPRSMFANPRNTVSELAGPAGANTAPASLRISLSSPPAIDTIINVSTSDRNTATPVASPSDVTLTPPAVAPLAPYTTEHTLNVTYTAGSPFIEVPISVFRNASGEDQLADFSVIAAGYQSGPVAKQSQQLKVVDTGDIDVQILFEVPDGLGGSQLVERSKLVETMGANAARLVIKKGAGLPRTPINANIYIVAAGTKLQTYDSLTLRGAPNSRAIELPAGDLSSLNLTLDTLVDADLLNNALEILVIADDSTCVSGSKTTTIDETSAATQLLLTRSRPDNPAGEGPVVLTPSMANNGGLLTITRPAGSDAGVLLQVLVQVRLDDATEATIRPNDGFAPPTPLMGLRLLEQTPVLPPPAIPGVTGIPGILVTFNPGQTSATVVLDPLAVSNDVDLYVIARNGANPLHGHEASPITADQPLGLALTRSTISELMGLNASTLTITRTDPGPAQEIYLQTRTTDTGARLPGHIALRNGALSGTGINGLPISLPAGPSTTTVAVDALPNADTADNMVEIYAISKVRTDGLNGSAVLNVVENNASNTLTLTRTRPDGTFDGSSLILTPSMANNGARLRITRDASISNTSLLLNVAARTLSTGFTSPALRWRKLETDSQATLTNLPGLLPGLDPVIPANDTFVDVVIDPFAVDGNVEIYVTAQSLANPIVGLIASPITVNQPLALTLTRSTIAESAGPNASMLTITRADAGPAQEIYIQTRQPDTGARLPGHAALRSGALSGTGINGLTVALPAGPSTINVTVDALMNGDAADNQVSLYAISKERTDGLNGRTSLTVIEDTPANTILLTRARPGGLPEETNMVLTPSMANNGAFVRVERPVGASTASDLPLNVVVRSITNGFAPLVPTLNLRPVPDAPLPGIPGLLVTIPSGQSFIDVTLDPVAVSSDVELYVTAQDLSSPLIGREGSPITADQLLAVVLTRSTVTELTGLNASTLTITRANTAGDHALWVQTRKPATGAALTGHAEVRAPASLPPGISGIPGLPVIIPDGQASVTVVVDALTDPDILSNEVTLYAISQNRADGLNGRAGLIVIENTPENVLPLTRSRSDGTPDETAVILTPSMANNAAFLRIGRPAGDPATTPLALNVAVRSLASGFAHTVSTLGVRTTESSPVPGVTGIPGLPVIIPIGQTFVDITLDPLTVSADTELHVTAQDSANPLIGRETCPITADQPLTLSLSRASVSQNMSLNASTLTITRSNAAGDHALWVQTRETVTGARLTGPVALRLNPASPTPGVAGINGLAVTIPNGMTSVDVTLDALPDADALDSTFQLYAISQDRTAGLNGKATFSVRESTPANSFTLELLNGTKDAVESAGNLAVGLRINRPATGPGSTGPLSFIVEVQNPPTGALDLTEIAPSSGLATGEIPDGMAFTTVYFNALNDMTPDGLQALNLMAISNPWPATGGFSAPISMAMQDAGAIPLGPFINEFNPDDDTHEFIELFAPGSPNAPLDGLKLAVYDNTGALVLPMILLDGKTTDAAGYFTIADPGVYLGVPGPPGLTSMDISLPGGPAAVALYRTAAVPASALTDGMSYILDSVVYGTTGNTSAPALVGALTFSPGQSPVDTGAADNIRSSRRSGAFSAATIRTFNYADGVPTAGYSNSESGFASWLGSFGLNDGAGGDSDGDGFKNIEEYAYGFNPKIANPALSNPATLPTFVVPIGELAALDPRIRVSIQTSPDMAAWMSSLSRSASDPPPLAAIPLTYTPPPPAPVPLFFRSKVEILP